MEKLKEARRMFQGKGGRDNGHGAAEAGDVAAKHASKIKMMLARKRGRGGLDDEEATPAAAKRRKVDAMPEPPEDDSDSASTGDDQSESESEGEGGVRNQSILTNKINMPIVLLTHVLFLS